MESLTPANQRSPGGFSHISSLSREVNVAENALPSSPRKRVSVLRRLANEFNNPVKEILQRQYQLSLSQQTITSVNNVYVREDISRTSPGKQNVVTIRDQDGKRKMQKRHLYMSIKEAHGISRKKIQLLK